MSTPTVNGTAAITTMRGFHTNKVGWCLYTVWNAYAPSKVGQVGGSYANAMDAWDAATGKHPGDRNPPAGVTLFYGPSTTRTDANAADGDVTLSLGAGDQLATDYPSAGVIGTCTIAQREAQTERPYLGWTEDICGYQIVYPRTASASKGPRIVKTYHFQDRTLITLDPGKQSFLHNYSTGRDVNVVGGVGPYVFTPHVYADGMTPGDALEVTLIWENTKNKVPSQHASAHYTERLIADENGVIRASVTFQHAVAAGDMVFVRVTAPPTNRGPAHVTLIDSDASLFA